MLQSGSRIDDFVLLREIGQGAMGVVCLATQRSLGREVAVKLLPSALSHDGNVAARFASEAEKMARLSHPNIVQVFTVGVAEDGTHYFAMQLLPGGSLEDRLRQGPVSQGEAVTIATEVAEALDYAHSQGITHRDIKPANIMFDGHGHAVVTDFGIAKAADDVRLTATGMAVGTPQYMAPEQARGNPTDGRADVYSLGAVLYEMVCGRPPFTGETPVSIAMKHMQEPPMPPRAFCPDLPEWLQSIILKALAKEPADRFATAREMAAALRAQASVGNTYAPTWPLPAQSPGEPQKVVRGDPSRSRTPLWAVVAICLLIGACLALAGLAGHNAHTPQPQPESSVPVSSPAPPARNDDPSPSLVEAPQTTAEVAVPDLAAKSESAARTSLSELGLVFVAASHAFDVSTEVGDVISQTPAAGTRLARGKVVSVVISKGEDPSSLPLDLTYHNSEDQWSIGYRSDWAVRTSTRMDGDFESRRTTFASPDGVAEFLVERGTPDEDPYQSALGLSDRYAKAYEKRYNRISVTRTTVQGNPAARWEFEVRKKDDVHEWHKVDVFVNANGRGYAILCQAHTDRWADYQEFFDRVFASVQIGTQ